jgi:Bacterial archaeo-eukaryotic release factor family 3
MSAIRTHVTGIDLHHVIGPLTPTPGLVLGLQAARAYPSVSLLMTTRPGPQLTDTDAATLERLAAHARRRIRDEHLGSGASLLADLDAMVTAVRGTPVKHGLALFCSAAIRRRVDLPLTVTDRCIVDPTFATRDLVRALHRTPRHVVLLLSAREARLFDGVGPDLLPARSTHTSLLANADQPRGAFLRDVDRALGAHLRLHPAALVLVGAEPTLSQFRNASRHTACLAGAIKGNYLTTPLPLIAELVQPVLERYLRSREHEALNLLETRHQQDRAVLGIDAAWLASRYERPEMLAVEESYFLPARISLDGDSLTPASDVEAPDVIDDAVDELIESVLRCGGWIAMVQDGALPDEVRVALTVQR